MVDFNNQPTQSDPPGGKGPSYLSPTQENKLTATLPNPCTGGALGCWHVGPAQSYGEQMRDVAIWTEGLSATNVGLLAGGALPPMGFPGNQRLSLGLRLGI